MTFRDIPFWKHPCEVFILNLPLFNPEEIHEKIVDNFLRKYGVVSVGWVFVNKLPLPPSQGQSFS